MKITDEQRTNGATELTVEVDPELLEKHARRAVRYYSKRLRIPGFRKGNVPRETVEREVGPEAIMEQALEDLAPEMIEQVIKERNLDDVVGMPRIKLERAEPPVTVKLTLAAKPAVKLCSYSRINLEQQQQQDIEERVEEALQQLQRQRSKWEIVNLPVQQGDLVKITATGYAADTAVLQWKGHSYLVSNDTAHPLEGFAQQLEGMLRGQQRAFKLTIPEGFSNPDLVGQTAEFNVTLQRTMRMNLAELDDAFAAGLGEADIDTLDKLRQRIADNMRAQDQAGSASRHHEQVVEQMIDGSTFTIADMLVEDEAEHLQRHQAEQLKRARMGLEDFLKHSGKTQEQFAEELRHSALKRIKRTVVLDALVEQENPTLPEGALDEEMAKIRADTAYARTVKDWDELQQRVEETLRERAALDAIISALQPEAEEAPPAEEEQPPADA